MSERENSDTHDEHATTNEERKWFRIMLVAYGVPVLLIVGAACVLVDHWFSMGQTPLQVVKTAFLTFGVIVLLALGKLNKG